MPTGETL